MNVLAIIPACAGSTELPNKNMRIILGKPMVYYAINNARSSRYVSRVVVSSNSGEVLSLAKQMKAEPLLRASVLCSSVPLAAVISDVCSRIPMEGYDYVAVMQSIAPTLRWETLDKAIELIRRCGYDSLISVRDRAQFSWVYEDGAAVPTHTERVNRHLLPPVYVETGAFLITRPELAISGGVVGERVGLYELDEYEGIDVNTFGDIRQAENALSRYTTAIYLNGNNSIGLGHIYRAIQISDELFTKPDIYFDFNRTDASAFGDCTYRTIPVDGEAGFIEAAASEKYDVIINDVLSTSGEYMAALRAESPDSRLINFEDEGPGARYADAVINALYEQSVYDNVRYGSRYYLLPKLFLLYEPIPIRDRVREVLVSFGGADPMRYTELLLDIAKKPELEQIHFTFVLGKAKAGAARLLSEAGAHNITMLFDIDNMPEIMSRCDAAVCSRGRTCFELAAMGIPAVSLAQNAREELHTFVCPENGFICLPLDPAPGEVEAALKRLVFSGREQRCGLQRRLLRNDLRNGRKNVLNIINTVLLSKETFAWEDET